MITVPFCSVQVQYSCLRGLCRHWPSAALSFLKVKKNHSHKQTRTPVRHLSWDLLGSVLGSGLYTGWVLSPSEGRFSRSRQ